MLAADLDLFTWPHLVSLLTLTALEIVLGIDNIVFLSILTDRLPPERRVRARRVGLGLALFARLALLFTISWVMKLDTDLFHAFGRGWSGKDFILLGGGLFLVAKATHEIYEKLEAPHPDAAGRPGASIASILTQIVLLDLVFSLDSVLTAVGMVNHLPIMVTAVVLAVIVMLVFVNPIASFVTRHPSMKVLALAFLILVGVLLVADGMGQHIERGYVYFAMAFSLGVELLNMRIRKAHDPVHLHAQVEPPPNP